MSTLRFVVPVDIVSANVTVRTSWQKGARIAKQERRDTFYGAMAGGLRYWLATNHAPFTVTLTRIVPPRGKMFDEGDNLELGFKHVRDEIAKLLGVDDSPDSPVTWTCAQERGSESGVKVEITGESR